MRAAQSVPGHSKRSKVPLSRAHNDLSDVRLVKPEIDVKYPRYLNRL